MENIVADSIKQGFYYGIEFWLKIFFEFTIPRIAPYIVGTIVVGIIAYIATKIVSNFSIMIGCLLYTSDEEFYCRPSFSFPSRPISKGT